MFVVDSESIIFKTNNCFINISEQQKTFLQREISLNIKLEEDKNKNYKETKQLNQKIMQL